MEERPSDREVAPEVRKSRFNARRILLLAIPVLLLLDIVAFVVVPPFPPGEPGGECQFPVCFINGNFEFPVPARGRLGVSLTPLSDQLAVYFGVKQGALVSAVESGSPASRVGIRAGDVITAINGREVEDAGDAVAAVRDASPGSTIEVKLTREKKDVTVKATLPERGRDRDRASRGRIRV